MPNNGWDEYKRLVVHELERSNQRLNAVDKRLSKIEQRLTVVHTKVYLAAIAASIVLTGIVQYITTLL